MSTGRSSPVPTTASAMASAMALERGPTVDDLGRRRRAVADRLARPGDDRRPDLGRVLGAGVVVGDDDDVGPARGGGAHGGPLAAVAVAAGTEDGDEPPRRRGRRAARAASTASGVWAKSTTQRGPSGAAGRDDLHPARHVGGDGHRGLDLGRREADAQQRERGERGVGDVEVAGQVRDEREGPAGRALRERERAAAVAAALDDPVGAVGALGACVASVVVGHGGLGGQPRAPRRRRRRRPPRGSAAGVKSDALAPK